MFFLFMKADLIAVSIVLRRFNKVFYNLSVLKIQLVGFFFELSKTSQPSEDVLDVVGSSTGKLQILEAWK